MHEVECSSRKMKRSANKAVSEEEQEGNTIMNSTNNLENKERYNDLGPYGDDSSDDSRSLNSPSDSDTDTLPGTESEDDIDLELLHGLEEIHITQRASGDKSDLLVPKGPQKTHKIRKQGKSASKPYTQQVIPGGRHVDYPPGECVGPSQYTGEASGVDMVLSESFNDLMYTLETEAEHTYPKLITPPLSSSDCSYPADYNPNVYSNTQHSYYHQYTPESLHTASPQSDVSLEEETSYQSPGDLYGHQHHQYNSTSQVSLTSHLSPPTSHSSLSSSDHYQNEDDGNIFRRRDSNRLSSLDSDCGNMGGKHLSTAENLIDNMCTGVKFFLASGKRHPGEVIDPYLISENRAQSLLALARVIGSKLESLKETEKRIAHSVNDPNTYTVYEYLS